MATTGEIIGNLINKTNSMQQSLVVQGGTPARLQGFTSIAKTYQTVTQYKRNVIGNIWGNAGMTWGGSGLVWNDDESAFDEPILLLVKNDNNVYYELFDTETFIDYDDSILSLNLGENPQ